MNLLLHKSSFATILVLLFLISPIHAAEDTYPFTSSKDAKRFQSLISETRCVVCQNQNIADSNAPLANDLRGKIYHMVLNKKSDEDIKNYLVNRYGEFILFQPRFNKSTILLWVFPLLSLIFIFPVLYRLT